MGFLAPVFSVVGGFLGSALGKIVVGIGLNVIVGKMEARRAKKAQRAAAGVQFERERGEEVSRKVACGPVGLAGHDCYVNTYGSANGNLQQVFAFSDFPCDALVKVWAGGSVLPLSAPNGRRYSVISGDYAGRMFFTFYDGTQTAADGGLIAHSNPSGRWTSAHLGSGMCYVIVELVYDQEKLNQFPDFFFELRGARLYDLRKDSSVGGSGNHRWGDYSTYEYTANPVIMDYNYRRGFSWNDDLFLGMDMSAYDLPFDQYATAANICDEGASYGRRFTCSAMLDADLDHRENIDTLMQSCGGIVIDSVEGSWPLIGSDQPIVATFTDDDLIADEPVKFRRRRSMSDLVNTVSGTYQEPANMWAPAGYDPQFDATIIAMDRRTRDEPMSFPQVYVKGQANQLASIYFNENRYEATASVVLRPAFRNIKAGDWVYWNSANKQRRRVYMVQSRSIRALDEEGPRNVALSLQERDGGIYDSVGVIPPTVPIPNGEPVYLNQLQDWAVIPVIGIGADGRSYPAFRMVWSAINDVTVQAIDFEWWLATEPDNVFTRTVTADKLVTFIQEGILSLTLYTFRHKLIADRPTNWSAPVTLKSLDGGNSDLEVGLGDLKNDAMDRLAELQSDIDRLREAVESLTVTFSVDGVIGQLDRQVMRSELGGVSASVISEREVRTSAISAMARRIEGVQASVGDLIAEGYLAITAQTDGDTLAKIELAARARKGEAAALAAMILEVMMVDEELRTGVSFFADRFRIVAPDGTGGQGVFSFDEDGLKLAVANIGTVLAGMINFGNGRVIIDENGILVKS